MKSRMITQQTEIDRIIDSAEVCHVGMVDLEGKPYVIGFNFGYSDGILYLHSGSEGKKIDIWKVNPYVCVSFSTDYLLRHQNEGVACSYSMKYKSVLLYGRVEEVNDLNEKRSCLNVIMNKYTGRNDFDYNLPALKNVKVFRIKPDRVEAKVYGY